MKVTVLITLYNKEPYVAQAVHSVLSSTFTDFELLVADDASTDDGPARVKAVADPRIRILESAVNTGRAAAANRGYDAARGEYVAVLDADDRMHPDRLAKQVAFMDAHPETGACGSWACLMDDPSSIVRMPATDRECRGKMLFGMPVLYPAAMLRRSVLEQHGLRCDPDWHLPGMDHLFLLRIGKHAAYANLQEALLSYRQGPNNMRHGRDAVEDRLALEREVFRLFGIPATGTELELHLAFHGLFRKPFDGAQVNALWNWKNKLVRMVHERALFPVDLFEAELDRRWWRLFHRFADHDLSSALTLLSLSRKWPADRLAYLAKTSLNRWAGRSR